jgi:colanic acid/amylovoran biosynthesis glycosyltransferase
MLPFDITLIEGIGADAKWKSQTLRSRLSNRSNRASLMDRLYRRLPWTTFRQPDDTTIVADFLTEQRINVVLGEYGTTAAVFTRACKQAGIPLVSHFHGFDASRRSVIDAYKNAYDEMFAYASKVIVVSRDMHDRLIRLGCPADKLVISRCGPNSAFMELEPVVDSNRIVAVGRLVEKKGPNLLILAFHKALTSHPELRLTIVGDGPMRPICAELITSLSLQNKVRLIGATTSEEIQKHMAESFLFAQHSVVASDGDSEGTPVAVMEASAAALPVVATRHAGIPDVIIDAETGLLVEERDVEGMAAAIVALAGDRARARAMGLRGRERIARHFTLEKHIADVAAVLCNAAAS